MQKYYEKIEEQGREGNIQNNTVLSGPNLEGNFNLVLIFNQELF